MLRRIDAVVAAGEHGETQADVARSYGVDATTIGRLAAPSPFEASPVVG